MRWPRALLLLAACSGSASVNQAIDGGVGAADAPLPGKDASLAMPDAPLGTPDAPLGTPDAPAPVPDSPVLPPDAAIGAPDARVTDGSPPPDARSPDATGSPSPDASSSPDAPSPPDAAPPPDAALPDAPSPPDAASPDASPPDAASPDAGGLYTYTQTFSGGAASAWPSPWTELGGVASQGVVNGRGRLVPTPSSYSLARVGLNASVRDVELTFTARFEDPSTQGIGFYVRQNGGWLTGTTPHGSGYAVFLESFDSARLGVWTEVNGVEQAIGARELVGFTLAANTSYRVRFRVTQTSPTTTRLQARVWRSGDQEPDTWLVDRNDSTASLQNVSDGFAIDSWSTHTNAPLDDGTLVDDIEISEL